MLELVATGGSTLWGPWAVRLFGLEGLKHLTMPSSMGIGILNRRSKAPCFMSSYNILI